MSLNKENITQNAKEYFENYINGLIKDRKYFYWELDYFKRIDNIFFQHYELSTDEKKDINDIGKTLISEDNIVFSIVSNSIRNELEIKNLSSHIPHYYYHSTYIKEYVLLTIMQSGIEVFEQSIKQQEINFIYTYLKYMLEKNVPFNPNGFMAFNRTKQYNKLIKSLNEEEISDEVKKDITALKQRLSGLKINESIQNKITFLFKLPNLEEKEELRFALSVLSENKKELFFRGQADSNWGLNPSIARTSKLLENEHNLFQEILALKPNDFTNDESRYEKLITMQHYGLPTRLLDLTRNPLISIFFACNNLERKNQDGLVYIFSDKENSFHNPDEKIVSQLVDIAKQKYQTIKRDTRGEDMEKLEKNYFIRGVAKNQRINNQSGDFIFVGLGVDSKDNQNVEELVSRYLIIDYKVKEILLENLQVMNIHGGSVYPELGNMSRYLVDKYK